MPQSLKRITLSSQLASHIETEIRRGVWKEALPSERELSDILQVSRNTCRLALEVLRRKGVLARRHGVRTRILQVLKTSDSAARTIGLLLPVSMEALRPVQALIIDELRASLSDAGATLRLHQGLQYYASNPASALERLTRQSPHGCWVVMMSTRAMQRWIAQSELPCVLVGSTYDRIELDSVDIDYHAACQHAAGQLLTSGHRHIALLNKKSRAAGDLESEAGFLEAVRQSSLTGARASIVYHDESKESVRRVLLRLMQGAEAPTGLVVANSYCFLTVASILASRGIRVPKACSLISRDDDSFLSYLEPAPARYVINARTFSRKLQALVMSHLSPQRTAAPQSVRIMPDYFAGDSTGPSPS